MEDDYGRPITSLRISVTQRCDLDCFYCHREGCEVEDREMTPDEIKKLVEIGKEFGIEKIKLTGGEPLVRDDIVDIVAKINDVNFEDISMTTNGVKLSEKAEDLVDAVRLLALYGRRHVADKEDAPVGVGHHRGVDLGMGRPQPVLALPQQILHADAVPQLVGVVFVA